MTCIDDLFETQAERTPEAVAVVFGDGSLTYRELNRRADRLACRLRELGVGRDALVALYLERSLEMVVGLLAVLKAGGAYVPLDPSHPRKRLAYMLADARPLVLLTQARLQADLPPHAAQVVAIDADAPAHAPAPPAGPAGSPRDLAYVIYTSGSTGEPKGVEIEHASVVNMLTSMRQRPGLGPDDSMLAITTLSFDIAALEIFLPLACGARVVIAGSDILRDGAALADLIARSGVTAMQATPATLRMLLDAGWQGDPRLKILCGGEAWTADLANELLPRCASLWNMYGPTETTVWSAVAKVAAGRPVAIGRPIANTRLYVLDSAAQLVPVGVAGELHIGGHGLARGYLRRPELTRERFVPDPYAAQQPGARMYRTGDLVRRQPDGTLEFLGRLDHQVKIRGHRIELGEVEAALGRQPGIAHCAVVARADTPGEPQLVAYFIPAGAALSPAELRRALGETLPDYMIPAAFVPLEAFPLTPNGKLDRKALPAPGAAAPTPDTDLREPRTPTEQVLARIWCEMLGRKQIDVRDNFFDLGGHSLLAVRVIGEINKALNARLHVPAFFQNPTIEGLARMLERKGRRRPQPEVLTLQSGQTGLPLYIMSARPDEFRLARLIGEDRTIYAIDVPMPVDSQGMMAPARHAALPTIEQLGALYGDVLRAHVGSAPCVVVGYSFFGKVAFEAARVLQRAGGNVACVLLVDAHAFTWAGTIRGPARQSMRWILRGIALRTTDGPPYVRRLGTALGNSCRLLQWLLMQMMKRHLRPANRPEPGSRPTGFLDKDGLPIDQLVIDRLIYLAGKSWQPRPLDAAGVLLRARFPGEAVLPGYDFTNGWRNLFIRGLESVQATGDHHSMMGDENMAILARQIHAVLDQYEAARPARMERPDADTDPAFPIRQLGSDEVLVRG